MTPDYYFLPASAYVFHKLHSIYYDTHLLFQRKLNEIGEDEQLSIVELGLRHKLRMQLFEKRELLPHVAGLLRYLELLHPKSVISFAAGRGTFEWMLLEQFPDLSVRMLDNNLHRLEVAFCVHAGGLEHLKPFLGGANALGNLGDEYYDVGILINPSENQFYTADTLLQLIRRCQKAVFILLENSQNEFTDEHFSQLAQSSQSTLTIEAFPNYRLVCFRQVLPNR